MSQRIELRKKYFSLFDLPDRPSGDVSEPVIAGFGIVSDGKTITKQRVVDDLDSWFGQKYNKETAKNAWSDRAGSNFTQKRSPNETYVDFLLWMHLMRVNQERGEEFVGATDEVYEVFWKNDLDKHYGEAVACSEIFRKRCKQKGVDYLIFDQVPAVTPEGIGESPSSHSTSPNETTEFLSSCRAKIRGHLEAVSDPTLSALRTVIGEIAGAEVDLEGRKEIANFLISPTDGGTDDQNRRAATLDKINGIRRVQRERPSLSERDSAALVNLISLLHTAAMTTADLNYVHWCRKARGQAMATLESVCATYTKAEIVAAAIEEAVPEFLSTRKLGHHPAGKWRVAPPPESGPGW